ncbi:hypothetical protein DOL94_10635 [Acinetobacter baumannii]|uniref:Uncharacterized protein n=1 Tax=Acinetobacter baumannii TaxID=470 RepID=A0A3F3MTF9_ACIBA|nr:hypothetical protein DOL94_10635 [Acinetobacter baumannii]
MMKSFEKITHISTKPGEWFFQPVPGHLPPPWGQIRKGFFQDSFVCTCLNAQTNPSMPPSRYWQNYQATIDFVQGL